jgi:hypothetical protein
MSDFEEAEARLTSDANELLATWIGPVQIGAIDYQIPAEAAAPERKQRSKQPQRARRKHIRAHSNR